MWEVEIINNNITPDFIFGDWNAFARIDYRLLTEDQSKPGLDAPEGPAWVIHSACTLDEVADELGTSREAVRRIEQDALRKCRAFCKTHGFRLQDFLGI